MFKRYICGSDRETYFNNLFNSLEEGFLLNEVICGVDGIAISFKILEFNNFFKDMFGVKRNIIGKTIKEVYPDIDSKWIETCGKVALSGKSIKQKIYIKSVDKHYKVNIISPTKGQFIILFNDITDIIKANEVLKKYFILFENAMDIIIYLKSDGRIIDANKTAVEKYGYSREEFHNMRLQQLREPSTMKEYQAQMEISASEGIVYEGINVKKDGTTFPVEVSSQTTEINGELFRIHIIRDITQRKESEEKIKYLANYDALTEIPNRGFFMYQFEKILNQSKANKNKFAVLIFDVDKFKLINDIHGHNAGDEVLKQVAKRLQEAVRRTDIIGRFGGDEFLVIQPFIKGKEDVLMIADRILKFVNKPVKWNDVNLDVHISIGITIYPDGSDNTQGLIHNADRAMYFTKKKGGNAYSFYINNRLF
ncbi:diguanylate cyclase domain-containing protein [Clostridium estertheticum]|uniref:diguanylate cyclase domain-containing protein n=1 Tax=Clostridium estertheticum TaxID=238834 RepID=UPI001C7CB176|nr:diguanylate cyclase [Clostridium estertheticum]MBX4264615.1 diguanylate cyclase [Clostridium estertheticum]MBX4268333.1 diguanylate cyclase [Clostridium estertheticum]WLC81599.1 diguanylate cyclase [Clostridium estertheticum]WLC88752.1 diguanylate cyclase [Clostridium estertheticum]